MKGAFFILVCLGLFACSKEQENPKYFNYKFYAVHKTTYDWEKNSFFDNQPISAKLESRMDFEDHSRQGRFEPIIENTLKISLDRNLVVGNDTILIGSNLLLNGIAEIELYKVSLNNEQIPDSYIIWLNRQNKYNYSLNNGYYTIYIDALTENQNQIRDSTTVYVQ